MKMHLTILETKNTIQVNSSKQRKEVIKMNATKNLARYVKNKAINLSAMSRATGIAYSVLYDSLSNKNRERPLSMDEAIIICKFLGVNPMEFAEEPTKGGERDDNCRKSI